MSDPVQKPPGEPAPRIVLRPAGPRDAPALKRWREEAEVQRYQPLGPISVGQLRAELTNQRADDLQRGRGEKFQWVIEVEGRAAGWITLVVTNWEHGLAEIGYALSTPYQRRGITPAALQQLLAELFLTTDLERIEARCAMDNLGSQRVLEKLGFQKEGVLRGYFVLHGERVDNILYAILRSDFLP